MPICNICCLRIIWFGVIVDCIVIFSVSIFGKVPFYCRYNAKCFYLTRILLDYF
jgi:hypothetical protein